MRPELGHRETGAGAAASNGRGGESCLRPCDRYTRDQDRTLAPWRVERFQRMASPAPSSLDELTSSRSSPTVRLRALVEAQYDFAWRSLRRLGVPPALVDDAAQQLFLVVAAKVAQIEPERERSFVFGTAVRIASDYRRMHKRDEARLSNCSTDLLPATSPTAEHLLEHKRARELLDQLLDRLPSELRTVLILTESEQMTMTEIAHLCELPPGTVASRLRRARAAFAVLLADAFRDAASSEESA